MLHEAEAERSPSLYKAYPTILRFTRPHSEQVILTMVCLPWPSLTRALTPGTSRVLHPRQVSLLRGGSSLTLNLSLTLPASSAWALARGRSVWESSTAESMSSLTRAAASSLASLRDFVATAARGKVLTLPAGFDGRLLSLVLAESALELVPEEIRRSPAVASDSKRRGVPAAEILLDRSFHHTAMLRLKEAEKRGRPDLVHVALLSVTGSPLYQEGGVRVFVHTYEDVVVEIEAKTRIPKNYIRFRGLMEKALREEPEGGLVKVYPADIRELVRKVIAPDRVVGLSVQGRPTSYDGVAKELASARSPCVVVGGFPHGHFSERTLGLLDGLARIDTRPLEAHVAVARLVYEMEKEWSGSPAKGRAFQESVKVESRR